METPTRRQATEILSPYITDTAKLTPIQKRPTNISLSPSRSSPLNSSIRTSNSVDDLPTKKASASTVASVELSGAVDASALEFEECSFTGEDGDLCADNMTIDQNEAVARYLEEKYNVTVIDYSFPFLVLGCGKKVPAEGSRPSTIAGAIALWKGPEDFASFYPTFGEFGDGEGREIDLERLSMSYLHVPSDDVVQYLANSIFPDADALTFLWNTMVVELPPTSDETFREKLKHEPSELFGAPFHVRYSNGPLPNTERSRRHMTPDPTSKVDWQCDETDYMKLNGRFSPRSMISSTRSLGAIHQSVSAGILVEKNGVERLTCSYHCWQDLVKKYPGVLGNTNHQAKEVFRVIQGNNGNDMDPGTNVGFLRARIGETDIGLAELHTGIVFENRFMEMDYTPKNLLHSNSQQIGDEYLVDSFSCGKQKLKGMGCRFVLKSLEEFHIPKSAKDEEESRVYPTPGYKYIRLKQGAYATNDESIPEKPVVRDRVCGSVLLRCRISTRPALKMNEVLERGETCGMLHYADIIEKPPTKRMKTIAAEYVCYADCFDPLIRDGWRIADPPPKDSSKGTGRKDNGPKNRMSEDDSLVKRRKVA